MKTRTMVIILGLIGLFLVVGYAAAYVIPGNENCGVIGFGSRGSCGMKYVDGDSVFCGESGENSENCENYGSGCEDAGADCDNYDDCPDNSVNCTDC